MARKKSERKPKTFGEAVGFRHIFESETTDFFLGFILLALYFGEYETGRMVEQYACIH